MLLPKAPCPGANRLSQPWCWAKPKGLTRPAKSHKYLCGQPCRLSILPSLHAARHRVQQELAVSAVLPPCQCGPSHQLTGMRVKGESCCSSSRCAARTQQEIPRFDARAEEQCTTASQLPVQRALHSCFFFLFLRECSKDLKISMTEEERIFFQQFEKLFR